MHNFMFEHFNSIHEFVGSYEILHMDPVRNNNVTETITRILITMSLFFSAEVVDDC